jgi:drug/metabolite transporter (DMT)-like permease
MPRHLTAPVEGALWMIAASVCYVLMTWSIRELAPIAASEVIFFRSLLGLFLVLPWLKLPRGQLLRRPRLGLFSLRALVSYAAMLGWFYGVQHMVLADAVALQFTLPLFTILLATFFLSESVGPRRWMATIVGFLGALLIIRPGFAEINTAALFVLLSAGFYAWGNILIKILLRDHSPQIVLFYLHLMTLPLALLGAIPYWVWPGWEDVPWIILLSATGSLAHYFFARALAMTDTSVVMPFDYLRLPMLAAIGYVAYGEAVTIWTWMGAAVICSATFYIVRREAQIARAANNTENTPSGAL